MDKKAKIAHQIWSHWMKQFTSICIPAGPNGTYIVPQCDLNRWKRLMVTEFKDLTDDEKESDYEMAELYMKDLKVINKDYKSIATKRLIKDGLEKI